MVVVMAPCGQAVRHLPQRMQAVWLGFSQTRMSMPQTV